MKARRYGFQLPASSFHASGLTTPIFAALQSYVCAVRSVQVLDRALIERGIVIDGEPSPLLGARNAASNLARSWSHSLGLVPDGRKQWKAEDEEEPPRESALAILDADRRTPPPRVTA